MERIQYRDLKVEDIRVTAEYDAIPDFKGKGQDWARQVRELMTSLKGQRSWKGPVSTDFVDVSDLASESTSEQPALAAVLASRKQSEHDFAIMSKCNDPKVALKVSRDSTRFLFDVVEEPSEVKAALEAALPAIAQFLGVREFRKLNLHFRHIFRLKQDLKNFQLLGNTLLPGLNTDNEAYAGFGADREYKRVDLSWVFYRKKGELVSQVNLDSPGNDDNTTMWLSVKTQALADVLEISKVQSLSEHFDFDEAIVASLLHKVFAGEALDTTSREMMSKKFRRS